MLHWCNCSHALAILLLFLLLLLLKVPSTIGQPETPINSPLEEAVKSEKQPDDELEAIFEKIRLDIGMDDDDDNSNDTGSKVLEQQAIKEPSSSRVVVDSEDSYANKVKQSKGKKKEATFEHPSDRKAWPELTENPAMTAAAVSMVSRGQQKEQMSPEHKSTYVKALEKSIASSSPSPLGATSDDAHHRGKQKSSASDDGEPLRMESASSPRDGISALVNKPTSVPKGVLVAKKIFQQNLKNLSSKDSKKAGPLYVIMESMYKGELMAQDPPSTDNVFQLLSEHHDQQQSCGSSAGMGEKPLTSILVENADGTTIAHEENVVAIHNKEQGEREDDGGKGKINDKPESAERSANRDFHTKKKKSHREGGKHWKNLPEIRNPSYGGGREHSSIGANLQEEPATASSSSSSSVLTPAKTLTVREKCIEEFDLILSGIQKIHKALTSITEEDVMRKEDEELTVLIYEIQMNFDDTLRALDQFWVHFSNVHKKPLVYSRMGIFMWMKEFQQQNGNKVGKGWQLEMTSTTMKVALQMLVESNYQEQQFSNFFDVVNKLDAMLDQYDRLSDVQQLAVQLMAIDTFFEDKLLESLRDVLALVFVGLLDDNDEKVKMPPIDRQHIMNGLEELWGKILPNCKAAARVIHRFFRIGDEMLEYEARRDLPTVLKRVFHIEGSSDEEIQEKIGFVEVSFKQANQKISELLLKNRTHENLLTAQQSSSSKNLAAKKGKKKQLKGKAAAAAIVAPGEFRELLGQIQTLISATNLMVKLQKRDPNEFGTGLYTRDLEMYGVIWMLLYKDSFVETINEWENMYKHFATVEKKKKAGNNTPKRKELFDFICRRANSDKKICAALNTVARLEQQHQFHLNNVGIKNHLAKLSGQPKDNRPIRMIGGDLYYLPNL